VLLVSGYVERFLAEVNYYPFPERFYSFAFRYHDRSDDTARVATVLILALLMI
jgi:hypothetical protein